MHSKSTPPTAPLVTYAAVVGKVLSRSREERGLKQNEFAAALGLSQSAYSRLEAGESILNLSQLRNAAMNLGMAPFELLHMADEYERQLRQQGVNVVSEKPDNPAAVAIGLGLLAALLLSAR